MGLRKHEQGAEVARLQQALLDVGYTLPRWGVDGWLGQEVLDALARLLAAHGERFDKAPDTVSDEELDFVYLLQRRLKQEVPPAIPAGSFFDMRQQAGSKHDDGERAWSEVTGVCLHQTASVLGEPPERWASVSAHVGITRSGKVIFIHDFDRLVHGNGWNTECVGIAMDGMYAGIEGDLRTFWRSAGAPNQHPQHPTPELVAAAKAAIRWIKAVVDGHGGRLTRLVAHRQASKDRQADPGSALWQAIAIPLHEELELTDGGVGFKLGTGYAIPEAWDSRYKGVPYWQE